MGVSPEWERLWEVFHQAREISPSSRSAFLDEFSFDAGFRRQLDELLTADDHSDGLFETAVAQELQQLEDLVPEPFVIPTNEILAGRFRIIRLIGRGGMGTVYEALDQELNIPVALKMMREDLSLDHSARERFHREINLARQITHPNACRIFDLFHHAETLFLTMELLPGETLQEKIRRDGPLPQSSAISVVLQITDALSAIHQMGIVHRDLKSSNIILVPQGNGVRAVVTDFGLAIPLPGSESLHVTQTGQVLGTPEFMAPEQLTRGKITAATDIYALGLVLYEMVTGKLPLAGESSLTIAAKRISEEPPSPRLQVPSLERNWERTILRCLERNPKHRFQNASEVAIGLKSNSITKRFPVFPSRHRTRLTLELILLIFLGVAAFLFWQNTSGSRSDSRSDMIARRIWTGATGLPAGVLSTNGQILIDVDWETADLLMIHPATGKKKRITQNQSYFFPQDFSPYPILTFLSPDAKRVAYSVQHVSDSGCDLRVVNRNNFVVQTLLSEKHFCANPVDWTADGNQILTLIQEKSGTARIALVSTSDSTIRNLKSLPNGDVRKMSLSPDNRYLVYDYPQEKDSGNHDIFLISLDQSIESRLIANPANDYVIGWSPDGTRIVFASDRSGTHDAWILETVAGKPKGAPLLARKDIGQIFPLKLDKDGSLYYAHLLTSRDVFLAVLDEKKSRAISQPVKIPVGVTGSNGAPDFTRDGRSLLFQTIRNPLSTRWMYNGASVMKTLSLDTNEEQEFPHQPLSLSGKARWSPDGQRILFYGNEENQGFGIYNFDFPTGKSTLVIPNPENNFVRQHCWGSKPNSFFYMLNKGGTIWLRDSATGRDQEVFSGADDFDLSPDGQQLAIMIIDPQKGTTTLKVIPTTGGKAREILKLSIPDWISSMTWTPDGYVLFAKGRRDLIDQPQEIWSIHPEDAIAKNLGITTEPVFDLRVHPDGRRIAIATLIDSSEVWVMENFLPSR